VRCRPRSESIHLVLLAVLLFGCRAGEVELYEPEGSGLASGLTVKVELDSAAVDIAQALGWADGVPDAEVRLHRIGTDFQWRTELTDSSGAVTFPDLIPGQYRLAGYRTLSDEEAAELGDRRRAFGDGRMIHFGGASAATLRLAPDERGSLVIGEVYGTCPKVNEVNWEYHEYLEVYNNSDTTIYLDGKILGLGLHWGLADGAWSCEESRAFHADPGGVWTRYFHRFPGSGTEYPLAPGETAVVARDAIDHSQIHPSFPDLTDADFELFGPSDIDNPSVPNMPEIGLASWFRGHGMELWPSFPYFLSEPVDVETLPHALEESRNIPAELVRIPREALLDVVATETNDAYWEQILPPCDQDVHRDFDRLAGGFIRHGEDLEYSVQRLVIDTTLDGRAILQDTNTSAVDLVRALYTVGTLPQPQLGGARRAAGKREH
jgi:hypothetical protein